MYLQDYLDKEYSRFVSKGRIQSLYRFGIRLISNLVLPLYFFSKIKKREIDHNIVVSLTTFPLRINRFWLVIECILRQSVQPSKICIWLAKDQFPKGLGSLPKRLVRYYDKGLIDIIFVDEDLRSHKKYFYAFQKYPNSSIVTFDDDIFYPSFIIKKLRDLNDKYPNNICSLRGYEVKHNQDGDLDSYNNWKIIKGTYSPSAKFFHTSGGGTLYKSILFSEEVLNKKVFKEHCLYADDVWLNLMIQISGNYCVKGNYYSNLLPVLWNGNSKLSTNNVAEGGNDKQLMAIIKYYDISEKDVFN